MWGKLFEPGSVELCADLCAHQQTALQLVTNGEILSPLLFPTFLPSRLRLAPGLQHAAAA